MQGTLNLAEEIVEGLAESLSSLTNADLRDTYSVYVSGSYVRGDFLEGNSDLDLTVVFRSGARRPIREHPSLNLVQSETREILGGREFPSHTPGGIDWNPVRWDWLPTPQRGPSIPGPGPYYLPFGIFLFDLHKHLRVLWGQDPRPLLCEAPDPASMASAWFTHCLRRMTRGDSNLESVVSGAFKSLQLAQILFGELTLDRTRLPALYAEVVPRFPMKNEGAELIGEILGATYPNHPPCLRTRAHYGELVEELWTMVQGRKEL